MNMPNHSAETACRFLMHAGFNAHYSKENYAINIPAVEPLLLGYCWPWELDQ